jgi:hypothetical protein
MILDKFTESMGFLDTGVRGGVREENNRQRSTLGLDYLFVESGDILQGGRRDGIVNEEDAMAPHQVPEEASVTSDLNPM